MELIEYAILLKYSRLEEVPVLTNTFFSREQQEVLGVPKTEWRASFLLPSYFQVMTQRASQRPPMLAAQTRLPVGTPSPQSTSSEAMPATNADIDG